MTDSLEKAPPEESRPVRNLLQGELFLKAHGENAGHQKTAGVSCRRKCYDCFFTWVYRTCA